MGDMILWSINWEGIFFLLLHFWPLVFYTQIHKWNSLAQGRLLKESNTEAQILSSQTEF